MAAPLKKKVKVLLEKDCEFRIGVRKGRVLELRPEGYFVFWEEWTDPETGECHESAAGVFDYNAVVTENNHGTLKILKRPLAKPLDPKAIRRSERVLAEVARQLFREKFVLAIQDKLNSGELEPVRDDFCDKIISIVAAGSTWYREYLAAQSMRECRRRGTKV